MYAFKFSVENNKVKFICDRITDKMTNSFQLLFFGIYLQNTQPNQSNDKITSHTWIQNVNTD